MLEKNGIPPAALFKLQGEVLPEVKDIFSQEMDENVLHNLLHEKPVFKHFRPKDFRELKEYAGRDLY